MSIGITNSNSQSYRYQLSRNFVFIEIEDTIDDITPKVCNSFFIDEIIYTLKICINEIQWFCYFIFILSLGQSNGYILWPNSWRYRKNNKIFSSIDFKSQHFKVMEEIMNTLQWSSKFRSRCFTLKYVSSVLRIFRLYFVHTRFSSISHDIKAISVLKT